MKKYKLSSRATTSGFKKVIGEEDIIGFPEINLNPVYSNGRIYIPTGYVCYEEITTGERE